MCVYQWQSIFGAPSSIFETRSRPFNDTSINLNPVSYNLYVDQHRTTSFSCEQYDRGPYSSRARFIYLSRADELTHDCDAYFKTICITCWYLDDIKSIIMNTQQSAYQEILTWLVFFFIKKRNGECFMQYEILVCNFHLKRFLFSTQCKKKTRQITCL